MAESCLPQADPRRRLKGSVFFDPFPNFPYFNANYLCYLWIFVLNQTIISDGDFDHIAKCE
jgi:hypothetical protein